LTIELDSVTTQLSSREFQLMEYFMRHPRQILSHDQIEQALWSFGEEPESNAVTTLIRRLRQRLQVIGARDWIETVHRVGYRLNPPS
jgi:DNA-binding response OmpR family regulator